MAGPTSFQSPCLLLPSESRFLTIPIRPPLHETPAFLPIQLPISLCSRNPNPLRRNRCSGSSAVELSPSPPTIVFIKGLPLSTSEARLRTVFSPFGEISRVKIIVDKKTKESLGFGYVWFASEDSAHLAVELMNGKFFDGRFVLVTIARPGSCKINSNRAAHYRF